VHGVDLESEVAHLRAENAALRASARRRERMRRGGVVLLLVLGCGLAALSVVAIWLRVTLLDTDRYVDTVAPIAAQPAVQDAVADKLETAIYSRIDFGSLAREVLPERADVMAPVIETGVKSFISARITDFTRSQRFQDVWTEANLRAHTRLIGLLEGGRSGRLVLDEDTVYLDLSPAVDRVKSALQERGLTRIASAIPPSVDGQIQLVQSEGLVSAQRGVRLLKAVAWLLPLLSLLCLAGSVFLSRPRRRGLLHAAIGVALAMLLLVAALGVARSAYLDALGSGALPRDAASSIFDTLVTFLRNGVRAVIIVAVLLALVSFVFGLPLGALWSRVVTDSRRRWFAVHRNALLLVVVGVGGMFLVFRDAVSGRDVLVVALVVAALCGAIAVLGLQTGAAVAEERGADHEGEHRHDQTVVRGHP
jgi:hypothetical protein